MYEVRCIVQAGPLIEDRPAFPSLAFDLEMRDYSLMRSHTIKQPWIVRASAIHGKGVFAHRAIKKNEEVFTVEGPKITYPDEPNWRMGPDWLHVGRNTYIIAYPDNPWIFINHSCDPNALVTRECRVVALRPLHPREEVTIDYAFVEAGTQWRMHCTCGSAQCRHEIRGVQYLPSRSVLRYKNRMLPYLYHVFQRQKVETIRRGTQTLLIAKQTLHRGETAFVVEGPEIRYTLPPNSRRGFYWLGISKNKWLIPYQNNPWNVMRHSCMPNVGITDAHHVKALCTIRRGEEITIDDSITEADPNWQVQCVCGSPHCRKIVRSINFLPPASFRRAMPYIPSYMQKAYRAAQKDIFP